jgi:hypothetical protein
MTQQESVYIAHTCDDMAAGKQCLCVDSRAPATCAAVSHRASLVRGTSAHCWCSGATNSYPTRF